jgi:hypothetical protein
VWRRARGAVAWKPQSFEERNLQIGCQKCCVALRAPKRQHIELTDQIVWASAAVDYCITSRSRCGEP